MRSINRRISRSWLRLCVGGAVAGVVLAGTPTAFAGGFGGTGVDCASNPAACTLTAHTPGGQGSGGDGSGAQGGAAGHGTFGRGAQGGAAASTGSGVIPPVVCTDIPFLPVPADLLTRRLTQPAGPGHWVLRSCITTLVPLLIAPIPVWIPGGAPALPDPRVLAAQALSKLVLSIPTIESSPGGSAPQTVELPTWAWLPSAQWAPLSATASVPGESVTATATPLQVTWSWGDGASTVCHGPGTPYVKGMSNPAAPSPDCGHTYRQTSAAAPNQQFPVTASLAWSVAWSGGGQSGIFPNLTTTATTHWTVRQIQSLIVDE